MNKKPKIHPGGLLLLREPEFRSVDDICYPLVRKQYGTLKGSKKVAADRFIATLKCNPANIEEYCNQHESYNKLIYADDVDTYGKITCESKLSHWPTGSYYVTVTEDFKQRAKPKIGVVLSLVEKQTKLESIVMILKIDGLNITIIQRGLLPCVGDKITVSIVPSTFNYDSWNRTIDIIRWGDSASCDVVFPKLSASEVSRKDYVIREYKMLQSLDFTKLTFNKLQKRAIAGILLHDSSKVPYILFGPPGTGKTTTLVEAVIQLVEQKPTNRILLCTPSNAAADHFALSLLRTSQVKPTEMFRVYSSAHLPFEKPDKILPITYQILAPNLPGGYAFGIPSVQKLAKFRVFIMTLSCSSYFISAEMQGSFSHIIVDEAGQAHEIETLIPICGLSNSNTRFVLAGDPKQLGPVESVSFARPFKLNVSMLERLIQLPIYKSGDARFMTMLCDNYRAHKSLVDLPSSMFYSGKLRAAVPVAKRNSLAKWKHLPQKGFPMMWHSICGTEEKEKKGFSYRNLKEATLVLKYVVLLMSEGVKAGEIGIVTPYRYQVKFLREQLGELADQLTVDSVEKYQGSERRVIIVSTVRCMGMGFMSCCRRLNTTITRAKELLIIVGNHRNMKTDIHWRRLISYCNDNKALIDERNIAQKTKNSLNSVINLMLSLTLTANPQPQLPKNAGDNDDLDCLEKDLQSAPIVLFFNDLLTESIDDALLDDFEERLRAIQFSLAD